MSKEYKRTLPTSKLDMEMLMTDPEYGTPTIGKDLKDKLDVVVGSNEEGDVVENLWDLLGYYKRDIRLGNLTMWNGELDYCQYYLDLAGDMLQAGYVKAFIICLSRVAARLELSQSKGGFLRKLFNTHRQEYTEELKEPNKKSFGLFGKSEGENKQ